MTPIKLIVKLVTEYRTMMNEKAQNTTSTVRKRPYCEQSLNKLNYLHSVYKISTRIVLERKNKIGTIQNDALRPR